MLHCQVYYKVRGQTTYLALPGQYGQHITLSWTSHPVTTIKAVNANYLYIVLRY